MVSFTPINNTGIQFNEEVEKNIKLIPQIGEEQFLNFWTDRLIKAKEPINKTIKENKFVLPGSDNAKERGGGGSYTKLRSAYQHRRDHVSELFKNEIFGIARSISEDSVLLYYGPKI